MPYLRIYADVKGETHYDEVDFTLAPVDFAPPAPPLQLSEFHAATRYGFCRFPVGWTGSWHPSPQRQFFCILAGTLEAQTSDGGIRRFSAGSCFLLEDTTGKGHTTRVAGTSDVMSFVVQLPAEPSAIPLR